MTLRRNTMSNQYEDMKLIQKYANMSEARERKHAQSNSHEPMYETENMYICMCIYICTYLCIFIFK